MNHVCGIDTLTIETMDAIRLVNEGGIAEQYVGQQLAAFGAGGQPPDLHYWLRQARTGNAEVDYVISRGHWIIPIEVKAGRSGSLKSLLQFAHEKRPPLAVRFDTNPATHQTVLHTIRTAAGLAPVTLPLLPSPYTPSKHSPGSSITSAPPNPPCKPNWRNVTERAINASHQHRVNSQSQNKTATGAKMWSGQRHWAARCGRAR